MKNVLNYISDGILLFGKNILLIIFLISFVLSRLETKNFIIDIFGQLSFQVLLGGILLLFILIFIKKLWSSIICALICIFLAADILPTCNQCNALLKDESQNYNKIRLMTFNTSYGIDNRLPKWFLYLEKFLIKNKNSQLNNLKDLENLRELILIENPDIIQLQEVTPKINEKLEFLESIFPYSNEINKFQDTSNNIILSKYPIKKNANKVHDSILTKILIDETELNFLGIHLYSGLNQQRFNLAKQQMLIINNLIQDIDENIILIGDLNMTPVSKRFINFLKETNLYTYTSFLNPTFTWPAYLPKYLGVQIDHVLFSENFKMIRKKTANRLGSDHRPLIVDLIFFK